MLLSWNRHGWSRARIEALSAAEGNRVRLADGLSMAVAVATPVLPPIPRTAHAGGGLIETVLRGPLETGFE